VLNPPYAGLGLRILYVEDELDIREALGMLLEDEGLEIVSVERAEQAMTELTRGQFDLLLTDYNLPGESGTWLIREAKRRGLHDGPTLIVTAHPEPIGAEGLEVLLKPIDIDVFTERLDVLLGPAKARAQKKIRGAIETPELTLYVTDAPSSARALRNLRRTLATLESHHVRLNVVRIDDPVHAESVARDRIVFTPTLVKQSPGTKIWIIGDLSNPRAIQELIESSRVPATFGSATRH
jgi:DNA-binding response OmpR family regulator